MRIGAIRVLGATFLACGAYAAPASAQTGHAAATGGATAPVTTPTPTTVGAAAPGTVPTTPAVQYMGPIVRTPSTPSVDAPPTQVSCLAPGATTAAAGTVPCPWLSSTSPASTSATSTGGSVFSAATAPMLTRMIVPGTQAKIVNGLAAAPASAPPAVQDLIWSANAIIGLPYLWGGGHASFVSPAGYDCSGTVSYALHGGLLLGTPLDSTQFESWGSTGRGRWISIFANGGHAYMVVAGLRLDTSSADDPSGLQGPRWRPLRLANAYFTVRHYAGL